MSEDKDFRAEPGEDYRATNDEQGEDVEGHMRHKGMNDEATDEGSDVEGHMLSKGMASKGRNTQI